MKFRLYQFLFFLNLCSLCYAVLFNFSTFFSRLPRPRQNLYFTWQFGQTRLGEPLSLFDHQAIKLCDVSGADSGRANRGWGRETGRKGSWIEGAPLPPSLGHIKAARNKYTCRASNQMQNIQLPKNFVCKTIRDFWVWPPVRREQEPELEQVKCHLPDTHRSSCRQHRWAHWISPRAD